MSVLDPETLARLKGVQLRSRQVVDGVLQGIHKSPHHGSSIEFSEHKEYSPGDEIRHIDWKAYGRLDKYYVKRFEQESNLRAWFVLDASGSMAYGREGILSKYEYGAVLTASLAYLLVRQQDAVGVMTFAGAVGELLPPRARTTHLSHLCAALDTVTPEGGTDLASALTRVVELARKRGLVLVVSDFFGDQEAAFATLRQLVGRGHQVVAFHVLDPDELEFPFERMTLFEGMESARRLLVEPKLIREAYLKRMREHRASVRERCLKAQVAHVPVDTSTPPGQVLLHYLTAREAASRSRSA